MKSILLKGGLGNQLFQLCLYLELSQKRKIKNLRLDKNTGFNIDFKYKRSCELINLKKNILFTSRFNSLFNLTVIIFKKLFSKLLPLLNFYIINDENYLKFDFNTLKKTRKNFLIDGYFQNYQIVERNLPELYKNIKPMLCRKFNDKFEKLYSEILSKENSVAICIRLYEESANPSFHALNGKLTSIEKFNKVIKKIENKLKNPEFYIFIQSNNEVLDELKFTSNYKIISHDNGYIGSWERLRAQSCCKHHIFNNSTFYFWGSIFSRYLNPDESRESIIFASDNFIFKEIYNPNWNSF